MSCKSALYMANTQTQTVAVNGLINFGSVIRRFGQNINGAATNVYLDGAGYYRIDTNFNLVTTAAGTVTVTLYKDGNPIPGATTNVLVAAAEQIQISIPTLVRNKCCGESIITAVITGIGTNLSNAAIEVEKV